MLLKETAAHSGVASFLPSGELSRIVSVRFYDIWLELKITLSNELEKQHNNMARRVTYLFCPVVAGYFMILIVSKQSEAVIICPTRLFLFMDTT